MDGCLIQPGTPAKMGVMELYERWLETCAARRTAWAVRDFAAGQEWSFGGLAEALGALSRLEPGSLVVASAADGMAAFVLKTLQAWRDGAVLMPVETAAGIPERPLALQEAVVHVKTTSGSTGGPSRVLFTASQLAADHDQIRETMRLDNGAPNLAVISPAHSYGFSNLVLPLLLGGMPLIAPGNPLPVTLRRVLAEMAEPVTLPAVPVMWRAWHQTGVLAGARVALAITAGAPMPLNLEVEIYEAHGLKVRNFYGASECGGIAFDDREGPRISAEEAGRPMSAVRLSMGEDGCLEVRGAAVALGYEDGGGERLGGGVFRTGDLARLEEGRVFLEGRATDTIHVAGRKVAPQVIEAALLRLPGVRHCVVFGVASEDAARVQEIVACVNAEAGVSQESLQAGLGRELPGWQIPRRWWLTSELRPDVRGKLSRAAWRERYRLRVES